MGCDILSQMSQLSQKDLDAIHDYYYQYIEEKSAQIHRYLTITTINCGAYSCITHNTYKRHSELNGWDLLQNKRKCLVQLRGKLEALNYRPPKRIPTKKPKAAKLKILETKKKQSIKKQLRQKPNIED